MLGDGRHLLYASWSGSAVNGVRMAILSLKTGEATMLDLPGIHPLAVVDGVLVYVTAGGLLMGVRVDLERGKALGTPVQLADNIATNASSGLARAALSPAGTLICQTGAILSRVVVVGPNGRTRPGLEDNRDYTFPRLSPDGKRLALSIGAAGNHDAWVYELGAGTLTRITTSGPSNERVEWSPDGKRVLYRADQGGRAGIWWRPVDLSFEATPLVSGKEIDIFEGLISPDGRYVVYQLDTLGADICYHGLGGDTTPHPIANSVSAIETMPRIAPDGRWIAFVTNESGRDEVVVQPFPGPGGRVQVSTAGGTEPVWSRDGRKLFYRAAGTSWRRSCARGRPSISWRGTACSPTPTSLP